MIGTVVTVAGFLAGYLVNWAVSYFEPVPDEYRVLSPLIARLIGGSAWASLLVVGLADLLILTLYVRYGLSLRSLYFFLAGLFLIFTCATDWLGNAVYTYHIAGASAAALIFAPLGTGWMPSLQGVLIVIGLFIFFFFLARLLFPKTAVPFGLGNVYTSGLIGTIVGSSHLAPALLYGMTAAGVSSP